MSSGSRRYGFLKERSIQTLSFISYILIYMHGNSFLTKNKVIGLIVKCSLISNYALGCGNRKMVDLSTKWERVYVKLDVGLA